MSTGKNAGQRKKFRFQNHTSFIIIFCLTLGLVPFTPEPHIWGKLKWLAGGAVGMKAMDWWDLVMHGVPWVLLILLGGEVVYEKFRRKGIK